MKLSFYTGTELGQRRTTNTDAILLDEARGLFLIADGTSFVSDGLYPAPFALDTIAKYLQNQQEIPLWPLSSLDATETQLRAAFKWANHVVYQKAMYDEREWEGFNASATALWFKGDALFIASVGECRAYRVRGETLEALTRDHTNLQEAREHRDLSEEEEENLQNHKGLYRYLGYYKEQDVDVRRERIKPGDIYLLSTDGIHDHLKESVIFSILKNAAPDEACRQLLAHAKQNNTGDDCAAVVICCE